MLPEALMALAAAGSTVLVGEMVKDGWTSTKEGFLRLVSRRDPDAAAEIEGRLENSRADLIAVPEAEFETLREHQALLWRDRIGRLLEASPEMESELRDWVQRSSSASIGTFTQTVVAKDDAQQAVLGSGVQHVTFQKGTRE